MCFVYFSFLKCVLDNVLNSKKSVLNGEKKYHLKYFKNKIFCKDLNEKKLLG